MVMARVKPEKRLGLHGMMVVTGSYEGVTTARCLVEERKSLRLKEGGRVAMAV